MVASRLRPSAHVERVFREGSVIGGPLLAFRYRRNGTEHTRWGYAVGKKLDKRSSRRDRLRRRLRALASAASPPRGLDIVVLARPGSMEASFAELQSAFDRLVAKLHAREAERRGP